MRLKVAKVSGGKRKIRENKMQQLPQRVKFRVDQISLQVCAIIRLMKLERVAEAAPQERIWTIDWHPHANMFVTAGEARTLKFWTLSQQLAIVLQDEVPTEHSKSIRRAKFSHKGNSLATASFDGAISIFMKGEQGYEQLAWLQGHQNEVKAVDWSPSDKKVVSCSRDKNLWVWTYNPTICDYQCETVLQGHSEDVKAVIWLQNDTLASCSYDNTVRIWAEEDGEMVPFQVLNGHSSTVWNVAFDSNSQQLYSCGDDGSVVIWSRDPSTQRFSLLTTLTEIHNLPVYGIALVKADLFVTCGGDNSVALVWQGRALDRGMHKGEVNAVSYGKEVLLSGGDDEKVVAWRILGL